MSNTEAPFALRSSRHHERRPTPDLLAESSQLHARGQEACGGAKLEHTLWLPDTRGRCGSRKGDDSQVPPWKALVPLGAEEPSRCTRKLTGNCTLWPHFLLFLIPFLFGGLSSRFCSLRFHEPSLTRRPPNTTYTHLLTVLINFLIMEEPSAGGARRSSPLPSVSDPTQTAPNQPRALAMRPHHPYQTAQKMTEQKEQRHQ